MSHFCSSESPLELSLGCARGVKIGLESGSLAVGDGGKERERLPVGKELWKKLFLGCSKSGLCLCTVQLNLLETACWKGWLAP